VRDGERGSDATAAGRCGSVGGAAMEKGPLVILSGPSGSGKSTVIELLRRQTDLPLRLSVSATTRAPRPAEVDGVNYFFWTRERFFANRDAGAFLEWAQVHGEYYGTLRGEVDSHRERGVGVILDIDVQGAEQVRKSCPDCVTIFLRASSWEVYEQRLRKRHTEDPATIARRLETAKGELARAGEYQYQVVNDDLEEAVGQLNAIVHRHFSR
jgi:guanylate kinase